MSCRKRAGRNSKGTIASTTPSCKTRSSSKPSRTPASMAAIAGSGAASSAVSGSLPSIKACHREVGQCRTDSPYANSWAAFSR